MPILRIRNRILWGRWCRRAYSRNRSFVFDCKPCATPTEQLLFVFVLDAGNGGSIDFGELTNTTLLTSSAITNPKFDRISINLSALGIPIDESVDSLVIQSIGNNETAIDLLMIVGMPEICPEPEPSSYTV